MNVDFLAKMKNSLTAMKEEILQNLAIENADFKAIISDMDPKDLVDIAADDIDRKMLESLGVQEVKRLRNIEAAISRIETSRYGLCIKCNKRIPAERLEAIPYALMCIECKSTDERRNR